jgi:tape measure domain-containing protein
MADSTVSLQIELRGAGQVKRDFTDIKKRVEALNKVVGKSNFLKKFGGTMDRAAKQFGNSVKRMESALKRLKTIENAVSQNRSDNVKKTTTNYARLKQELVAYQNMLRQVNRLEQRQGRAGMKPDPALRNSLAAYQNQLQSNRSMSGAKRGYGDAVALTSMRASLDKSLDSFRRFNGTLDGTNRKISRMNTNFGGLGRAAMNTGVVLSSLTAVLGFREILDAIKAIQRFEFTVQAASSGSQDFGENMSFLNSLVDRLGLSLADIGQPFGRFIMAAKESGIEAETARSAFAKIAASMRNLGGSAADTTGVVRAFEQSLSKGKFMAEEIRLQLGDRLPVAMSAMKEATGMAGEELNKAFEQGLLSTDKYFLPFVEALYGMTGGLDQTVIASEGLAASQGRLSTAFARASDKLGKAGLTQAVIDVNEVLTDLMESDKFETFLEDLGTLAMSAAGGFKFLAENIDKVMTALGLLAAAKGLQALIGIGRAIAAMNPYVRAATVGAGILTAGLSLKDAYSTQNDAVSSLSETQLNSERERLTALNGSVTGQDAIFEKLSREIYDNADMYETLNLKPGTKVDARFLNSSMIANEGKTFSMQNGQLSMRNSNVDNTRLNAVSNALTMIAEDRTMASAPGSVNIDEILGNTLADPVKPIELTAFQKEQKAAKQRLSGTYYDDKRARVGEDATISLADETDLDVIREKISLDQSRYDILEKLDRAVVNGTVTTLAEKDALLQSLAVIDSQNRGLEKFIKTKRDEAQAVKDAARQREIDDRKRDRDREKQERLLAKARERRSAGMTAIDDLSAENDARANGKRALASFNEQMQMTLALRRFENSLTAEKIPLEERLAMVEEYRLQLMRQRDLGAPAETMKEGFDGFKGYMDDYINDPNQSPGAALEGSLTGAFATAEGALETFIKTGKGSFKDLAQTILIDIGYAMAKAFALKAIKTALAMEDGGIVSHAGSMPLKTYARGGVASSPQLAVFGEGSTPEAYVPLPDGRTIPVTMSGGGGGGQVTVIQNFDFSNADNATEARLRQAAALIQQTTKASIYAEMQDGGNVSKISGRR